jgi:medium-chain acyl-[acyl-carrier-protein] hydrolase
MPNSWITCPHPNPQEIRLFCLPYAGGGTVSFRGWSDALPHLEVCPIQLPGRERRLSEAPFSQLDLLLPALTAALLPYLNQPYALFGHSMGGLIAFELVRALRHQNYSQPVHLFIAGCRPPQLPNLNPILHNLPDAAFLKELHRYNGTPEAVLANTELMELLLPTLRADFTLVETYAYQAELPLTCPISVFGGLQDNIVVPELLAAWQAQTTAAFTKHLLPGDHFFLHSEQSCLLRLLAAKL